MNAIEFDLSSVRLSSLPDDSTALKVIGVADDWTGQETRCKESEKPEKKASSAYEGAEEAKQGVISGT